MSANKHMRLLKKSILLGSLMCVLLATGCAAWPYTEKHIIAIRSENGTSADARLVQCDTGLAYWALLKPCYAGPDVVQSPFKSTYYVENKSGRRAKVESLTFLKKHDLKDYSYQDTLWGLRYYVRPVLGTDLWAVLDYHSSRHPAVNGTNKWDSDKFLKLYVFNNREIVRQRELIAYAPRHHNDTIVDFRFDASNQRLTYLTTHGYETYDLLRDTVSPSGVPPGKPALTIEDYGGHAAGWTPGWEPSN
jgi:hypothetical protein